LTKQKNKKCKTSGIIFQNLDNTQKHQAAEAFIEKILVGTASIEIVWKA